MADKIKIELSPKLIEELAESLHSEMEHLDPTEDEFWSDLSADQKEFYRQCVAVILQKLDARRPGYFTDNSPVIGSAQAIGFRAQLREESDAAKNIGCPVDLTNAQE